MKLNFQIAEGWGYLLLLVAVALVGFYLFVYLREGRQAHRMTPGQMVVLWGLRGLVALLAVFALANPALRRWETSTRLPVVPIVVDESESMSFPDARDNPLVRDARPEKRARFDTAQTALQMLQEPLSLTHRLRVYTFSNNVELLKELPFRNTPADALLKPEDIFVQPDPITGLAAPKKAAGGHSNIGDGLAGALRTLSGDQVPALVLFSDGRRTGGLQLERLIEQARQAKVPIHTVVFGSEFPLRDLRIDEVSVGSEASLGDVLTFHVKVTNQIEESLDVEMKLSEADADAVLAANKDKLPQEQIDALYTEVGKWTVRLRRGQQTVPVVCIPETEGLRSFRITLPIQDDEINVHNNETVVSVSVVKRTLKVLLVASEPNREYAYMVPALLRDPVIDLSCWLQSADVDYTQQGNTNIERLPKTMDDWSKFDVAVLIDPDPNQISVQQISGLEEMVRKGGGLMLVAGRTQGLAKLVTVHATKVRALLPIEVEKNQHPDYDRYFTDAFTAERTRDGKMHPVLRASGDQRTNEQVWATFPKFYWSHPTNGPKPGAVVLLERTSGAGKGECLMATHRYGEGAVLYCGLDSLWLWRYPAESYDYDRFWTRAIRYLGEARLMGTQQQVSLTTDRRSYAPGQDVQINLQVLDPALMAQLSGQKLHAQVTSPERDEYMVPLSPAANGEPMFVGRYPARWTGTMQIRCRQAAPNADSEAKPLFDVKHSFQVAMQSLEHIDTSADLEAMRNLAEATGGKYFDYHNMSELKDLAKQISPEPQVLRRELVREIVDQRSALLWTFMGLFLGLISAEWSLRKWWGLL